MQSAVQAAAHRKQATHFSSPFSSRCNTCAPRKRSWSCAGASGYSSVIVVCSISLKVTPIPLAIAAAEPITSPIFAIAIFRLTRGCYALVVNRADIRKRQPESHHLFVAGFSPADGLRGIGVQRIVRRVIEIRGSHQLRPFGKHKLMPQEVCFLPPEIVLRNIEQYLFVSVRKNGCGGHALSAIMHMRRIGDREDILRQRVA